MTDTSSSPRWWDFKEFSSAKPSEAQRVTRDAHPADPMATSAVAPVASQLDPAYSDATPTDEFLASLPDDMAEAALEVAGYATTPPVDDQAVPLPPAADEGGDWVLPSMPGFAADLPTPPAPQAADSALIDLPDAADWAAEAEALEHGMTTEDDAAGLADWDIPAVPGLHDEAEATTDESEAFAEAYAMPEYEVEDDVVTADEDAAYLDEDATYVDEDAAYLDEDAAYLDVDATYLDEDAAYGDEDENVEYIPGTWSEDGGSWTQEGEEKRWTGADGGGSVVTTDMPDWIYEGPSTADEAWDEYEAYETAVAEYEAATGRSIHDEETPDDAEHTWVDQAREPVAVAPIPPAVQAPSRDWEADQSWDAVADDDATSWDLPADGSSEDAQAEDSGAVAWDAGDDTQAWAVPATPTEDAAPAAWTAADESTGEAASDETPITWEDINTWADESELAHQGEEPAAEAGVDWGTTAQAPGDWDTQAAASWDSTPAEEAGGDWDTPAAEGEASTEAHNLGGWNLPDMTAEPEAAPPAEAQHLGGWNLPDMTAEPEAAPPAEAHNLGGWNLPDMTAEPEAEPTSDDSLLAQPDAFGATDAPAPSAVPAPPADTAVPGHDWQVTDTESSWASAEQDATPAWGAPEEDTTTSWTSGEADVTPAWGTEPAAESQWTESATEEPTWEVPAPPTPGAMQFAAQSEEVLADPLSATEPSAGFPTAEEQLPPPPPVGGSVPMAPEDLPEWMRPDDPAAEEPAMAVPLAAVSEEEAVAEEIAAPFNPVIAGVEDAPAAKVQDPGLITAPIPEDELPPPPNEAAPVRPTWGQPGPSGIGPAPITSPTLSHPVPEGGEQAFAVTPAGKAGKGSSLKRILIAVLAALLMMGGVYAAWDFYIRDTFFATAGGVADLKQGDSSVTFAAETDNQVQWTINLPKNEAFALTMDTPAGIQVGFIAQNAEGQPIGAANALDDGRNGYRFVAQNDADGPITLTAKASDSISADINMRIVPFAGTIETVDGVQWNVTVPADQSALINVLTRGSNPNVVISTADGTEIGSSESFQSVEDEDMYNAQFKVPAQAAEQPIVITLKTDQAYDATSTLIVDLHK